MNSVTEHILDITKVSSINVAAFLIVDKISIQGLLQAAVLVTVFVYNSIKIYQALKNKKKENEDVN
jgi:hypothetical protein